MNKAVKRKEKTTFSKQEPRPLPIIVRFPLFWIQPMKAASLLFLGLLCTRLSLLGSLAITSARTDYWTSDRRRKEFVEWKRKDLSFEFEGVELSQWNILSFSQLEEVQLASASYVDHWQNLLMNVKLHQRKPKKSKHTVNLNYTSTDVNLIGNPGNFNDNQSRVGSAA